MVLTVTLNPAIDKTYRTQELIAGHVNRMKSMENIPGGKGINVSKILCQYGCPVTATGFLGGYTGRWIEEKIRAMGIVCDFVEISGDTRCSMNVVANNGFVTEILEPGPHIGGEDRLLFYEKYRRLVQECGLVVLSGSASPGLPEDIYVELIAIAKAHDKRVILDTSLELLRKGVEEAPYLVKPNRRELEYLAGHRCSGQAEILDAARKLLDRGIAFVAVSVGEKGMYLLHEQRSLFVRAPRVKTVNTVGCGDSACASFAMSLLNGETMEEMLCRAVAVSAASAATMESGSVSQELVEELMESLHVEVL